MYIKFSSICKVHKKSLEKIISQNVRMGEKLEILITGQKNLENRIMDLEKSINNNNNNNNCKIDPDYVKVIKM
jgi:phosphotransferase system HPr-like phosphotransfer protein